MQTFTRDGLVFDLDDTGPVDGPVVVLLHGFPQDRTAWSGVTPELVRAGYRVLAPDQRGYSPRARPAGRAAYRRSELVADVLALLDTAGAERAHVVGHDWGGLVGWALGADVPDRVVSLTVVSTPHPRAMAAAALCGGQALRSAYVGAFQLPGLPEWALTAGGGARARRLLLATGLDRAHADDYTAGLLRPGAAAAALAWYRALPLDAATPTGPVGVPTRYLWGARDPALGRTAAEATGRFVTGPYRFDVLPVVGHWVPETVPQLLAARIREHLDGSGGRGSSGRG